jgi:lysophospholipase L1-like esterase
MIRRHPNSGGRSVRSALAFAALLAVLALAPGASAALPSSIASLGDSLIRGWGTDGTPTDAYAYSWATGTDTSVDSHYLRLLARTPAISGQTENYARLGAKMADVDAQASGPVTAGSQYVAIMAGTNDVCASSTAQMTSVVTFSSQLSTALTHLTSSLPSARILVASIPNWPGVWQQLHANPTAVNEWSTYNRCPDVLGPSATDADRAVVAQRIMDLNAAEASICAQFAACVYDGGAVYNLTLVATDLTFDYFHLSPTGQARIAAAEWQAGSYVRPAPLENFSATGGAQAVSLGWSVPGGVSRVLIVEKLGGIPTAPNDGSVVYDGSGAVEGTTVTGLTPTQTYGYAAWTYDVDGGEGEPVNAQATPTVGTTPPPTHTGLPTISGNTRQGQTLNATTGSWNGAPTGYGYQWRRCDPNGGACTDIAGATAPFYPLGVADVGSTLRVRVTASNGGGSSTAASLQTAMVTNPAGDFYDTSAVDAGCGGCTVSVDGGGTLTARIQGGADNVDTAYGVKDLGAGGLSGRVYVRTLLGLAAAQVLNANLAVFDARDAANALVYELYVAKDRTLRLWSPTAGLRSASINISTGVVVPNDGSSSIVVEVSALANSSAIVRVGGTDRISLTGLSGATTGNQRYLRIGIDHYDAQTTSETVVATHASVGYSQSGWLGQSTAGPPTNTSLPTIMGTPQQGQVLTATNGSWSNSPSGYGYQWRRCDTGGASCGDITGAVSQTYSPVAADVGWALRVAVTASNGAGSATALSAATAVVSPPPAAPTNTAMPSISGTPEQGQVLAASNGTWTDNPTSYAYQWQRCGSDGAGCGDIGGATAQTYTVAVDDVGGTLRVLVTASNGGGSTSAESDPSAVIVAPTIVNLAPDPDFESDPATSYATDGPGVFSWATDAARSGSHSLKIVSSSTGLCRWLSKSGAIAAQPRKTYTASAWVKTASTAAKAGVTITLWKGSTLLKTYSSTAVTGAQPFTQVTVSGTAPSGATSIRVEFRLKGKGTLWTDDVVVSAQ